MTDDALPSGTVTVLFTDLQGSTELTARLGDEAARRLFRGADDLVREKVLRSEGKEVKGLGDGVMAAFRSARQAVDCAVAIQRTLHRMQRTRSGSPLVLRIGLNTGEVIKERDDLFGSAVNAAKRIEACADPGAIFMSETTRALLGPAPDLALVDKGEHLLKGFDLPWRLFEVKWRTEREAGGALAANEPTPFVGRDAELARLLEFVDRAIAGEGSLVVLAGEAGVGKSRLVEEVEREARLRGVLTLSGTCQDIEVRQPYLPFIEMLERAAQIVDPRALRTSLGPNAAEAATLVPEYRQLLPDIPPPIELPPEQERRHMLNGIAEFLHRGAEVQTMLLIFEDLQWADEATLHLLRHVAPHLDETAILIVGTYRDGDLGPAHPFVEALQDLHRKRLAHEIVLPPLDAEHVAAMLEHRGGAPSPEGVCELIFEETDGNPFFVEELFRHLQESGKLFGEDGAWSDRIDLAPDEVPRGVRLLIGRRLARLSDDCRQVLACASVVGRVFSYELLAALADLDDDRVVEALEEAEHASLVRDVSQGRDIRYRFAHEQVRQTLIGGVSSPRRQRMHRRIGEALEKIYGSQAERHAGELAHHFYEAGAAADAETTTRYLHHAAEHALSTLAYEEALWYVDAARTTQVVENARLFLLRALAFRGLGRIEDAFTAFDEAVRLAPTGAVHDDILRERAELSLSLFRGNEAVRDFELLIDNAVARGDREAELRSLLGLGAAHYVVSMNESSGALQAKDTLERAYTLASELEDKAAMATALMRTRWFTDFWPEYRAQARANADEALTLARDVGDERLILDARSFHLLFLGAQERSEELESLRTRLEAGRDPLRLKEHYFQLMRLYPMTAQFERCVEVCDRAITLASELGVAPVMYPTIKAEVLMDLGRYGEAMESLQHEVTAEPFGEAMQRYALAFYHASVMDLDQATERARDAIRLGEKFHRAWMRAAGQELLAKTLVARKERSGGLDDSFGEEIAQTLPQLRGLGKAEVLLSDGEVQAALEGAERFVARAERDGLTRNLIIGSELRLRALLKLERWEDVLAVAEGCIVAAEQAGFRPMLWRMLASRGHARSKLGDRPGAEADLARARDLVRDIGGTIPDATQRERFLSDPLVASIGAM